jgi:hypothetical protein
MLAMILSYENFLEQAHLGSYNFDVHSQLANRVGFKPGPKLTK